MLAPIFKGLLLGLILSISLGPVIFAILKQSITKNNCAILVFIVTSLILISCMIYKTQVWVA